MARKTSLTCAACRGPPSPRLTLCRNDKRSQKTLSDFPAVGYYTGEMQSTSDAQLLREYAAHGADAAFAELVQRHTNLIYSAAFRQVNSLDVAAEIAQN